MKIASLGRILLSAVLLSGAALGRPDGLLVSPAWLAQNLDDPKLVLLHVGARADFENEHIAGARFVTTQDLSLPRTEGALLNELLPPDALQEKLRALGVSDDSRIVVYFDAQAIVPAARVYFSLDAAGLGARSSILDGGLPAWKAAGGGLTREVKDRPAGRISVEPRPEVVAGLDEVRSGLASSRIRLIDARAAEFFDGSPLSPRTGHIPGARNIPHQSLVTPELVMKPVPEIARIFESAGVEAGDTVVTYCNTGQQAAVVYFAARLAGVPARIYDGSLDEWSRSDDRAMETSPAK